jgi:hypothetical protein
VQLLRRWFGLRCALRMCPAWAEWIEADPPQHWAVCQDCKEKRVFLGVLPRDR